MIFHNAVSISEVTYHQVRWKKDYEWGKDKPTAIYRVIQNDCRGFNTLRTGSFKLFKRPFPGGFFNNFNPLNAELNPICCLLALLAHHFLHVSRIRVKSLTLRLLMSHMYGAPILDVSRSHTTTHHSR